MVRDYRDVVRGEALEYFLYGDAKDWDHAVDLAEKDFLDFLARAIKVVPLRETVSVRNVCWDLGKVCSMLKQEGPGRYSAEP